MREHNLHKKDEGKEFIESIQDMASMPDPFFRKSLEEKLVSKINSSNNLFNFSTFMKAISIHSTKHRLALFLVAIFLTIAGLGGGYYLLINESKESSSLTKEQIFAKMIQNNTNRTLSQNVSANDSKLAAAESYDALIYPFYDGEFNYIASQTSFNSGPQANSCFSYYPNGIKSGTSHSVTYYDRDNQTFYSKYISFDSEGNVYDYSMTNADNYYIYHGGAYAISQKNETYYGPMLKDSESTENSDDTSTSYEDSVEIKPAEEIESSTDEPLPSEDIDTNELIKNYFGENTELLETQKIDGKDYYVMKWSYEAFCDGSTETSQPIIIKAWVNSDTFEIYKQEQYINSISENLLVDVFINKTEKKNISITEAQNDFTFEYNVPIKEIEVKSYSASNEEYLNSLKNYLVDNSITILKPENAEFKISSAYSDNVLPRTSYDEVLEDKAFYSNSEAGEYLYNEYIKQQEDFKNYLRPLINVSYYKEIDYKSLNIEIFPLETTEEKLKTYYSNFYNLEPSDISLSINDSLVTAKIYKQDYSNISASSEATSGEEILPADDYYCPDCKPVLLISFVFEGKKYMITAYDFESIEDLSNYTSFSGLSYKNEDHLKQILDMVKSTDTTDIDAAAF